MPLYQQRTLSTAEDVGEPGLLPVALRGLSDEELADLTARGLPDTGFFPIPEEEPEPEPEPVRWIHKSVYLQRFTPQERIAIKAARSADPIIDDSLYVLEASELVYLDHPAIVNGLAYLVSQGLLEADRPAVLLA